MDNVVASRNGDAIANNLEGLTRSPGDRRFLCRPGGETLLFHVAVSPDSRRIFTGGFDNITRVWDSASGQELLTLKGKLFTAPGISPDSRRIVAGPEPPILVWEVASPDQVADWRNEERLAVKRIEAERRERAEAEARHRASLIKDWLVLDPVQFEGTNGGAKISEGIRSRMAQE